MRIQNNLYSFKYKKSFLKDLKKLPSEIRFKIEQLVFQDIPVSENPIVEFHFEKMTGYKNAFKKRVGKYRIGIFFNNKTFEFRIVKHRKEIYRYFP